MIKRNKIIAKIMVVALCANSLPCVSAFAAENNNTTTAVTDSVKENTESDFEFNAKTGTITKYTGKDSNVVVPAEIKGVKVTAIGEGVFRGIDTLRNITLPDSIKSIGKYAFWYCSKLESVKLPENLTTIPEGAFGGCDSLKSIVIPDSVTTIGETGLAYCDSLEEVKLPSSLKSLEDYSFAQDWHLKEVTLPDSLTSIGDNAFNKDAYTRFNVGSYAVRDLLTNIGINKCRINLVLAEK